MLGVEGPPPMPSANPPPSRRGQGAADRIAQGPGGRRWPAKRRVEFASVPAPAKFLTRKVPRAAAE